jgi:hypothetical protein
VFSPVEVRNPASSAETSRSASKSKTQGKESSSSPKKGKKKANLGAGGIEEVVGSLGAGVPWPSALDEEDPAVDSGPSARSKAAGKSKDNAVQDDDDDDMYATEEDDGTFEAGLPRKRKRKSLRVSTGEAVDTAIQSPIVVATPVVAGELSTPQGQHQHEALPTDGGIPMAIDPALEALHVPTNKPPSRDPESSTSI